MQRQSPRRIAGRTILAIADNGMPEASNLRANLVFATGLECKFDQRLVLTSTKNAIVRDCQRATPLDPMHSERLGLCEIVTQRPQGFGGHALHDGKVFLGDSLPGLLKGRLDRATSCEHDQARSRGRVDAR
jgi:hypothetical protein